MGVGHFDLVTVPAQSQLLDDEWVQQADQVGTRADQPGRITERLLERARTAELLPSLQDEHTATLPGQVRGCGQPVVPASDHHHVPASPGQIGQWGRQPDPPELILDAHLAMSTAPLT
jgi:hypothetical protein